MKQLLTDIKGIIRELNISVSDVLYPIYETIVNSIQSIQECPSKLTDGTIRITIERDKTQQSLFEAYASYPIQRITIEDDGIGFTASNLESFSKAHSTKKLNIGGKGLGRFAVLSVFRTINVTSHFIENGVFKKVTFNLSEDGLSEPVYSDTKATSNKTIVILEDLNLRFQKESSKYNQEEIANNILEHCLLYFLSGSVPNIYVEEDGITISLSNQFNPHEFVKHDVERIIYGNNFKWYVVKKTKGKFHEMNLCAHNRKVKGKKIEAILPIFASPIIDFAPEGVVESYYTVYVVSQYLDNVVNSTRNGFNFPKLKKDSSSELDIEAERLILEKDIDAITVEILEDYFQDEISLRAEERRKLVEEFRASDDGLEFRHLTLDQDFFNSLPNNADPKKISDALYELDYKHGIQRRKKRDKLLQRDYSNKSDYQELMREVAKLESEEGISKLAQYVYHRHTIIQLLNKYLEWCDENQDYEQESALHNLIYTMGGNHSSINYDKHNLWLIDDRLAFHRYIYSDTKINKQIPTQSSDSLKEPDIAIYDIPFTYGEQNEFDDITSIVIFELKRPNRKISYEEFSHQMRDQIKGIRKGYIKNVNGANISVNINTPIFFYFVCDTNSYEELKSDATYEGFVETPYKSLMRMTKDNVFQEILTYKTVLANAKRRNLIFFKKLGIS